MVYFFVDVVSVLKGRFSIGLVLICAHILGKCFSFSKIYLSDASLVSRSALPSHHCEREKKGYFFFLVIKRTKFIRNFIICRLACHKIFS